MVVNILLQSSNGFLMAARVLFVAFSECARISSPLLTWFIRTYAFYVGALLALFFA